MPLWIICHDEVLILAFIIALDMLPIIHVGQP
jgi:hypothetical protein